MKDRQEESISQRKSSDRLSRAAVAALSISILAAVPSLADVTRIVQQLAGVLGTMKVALI